MAPGVFFIRLGWTNWSQNVYNFHRFIRIPRDHISSLLRSLNTRKSNESQTHIWIEYELSNLSVQRKLGFVVSEFKQKYSSYLIRARIEEPYLAKSQSVPLENGIVHSNLSGIKEKTGTRSKKMLNKIRQTNWDKCGIKGKYDCNRIH